MGHKPSNFFQMDRPESGGADHNEAREHSGLLNRAKQDFAQAEQAKHESSSRRARSEAADLPAESGGSESKDGAPRHPDKDSHSKGNDPPFTTTGPLTAPKFGSAGSGGAEYEPGPERPPR